MFESLINLMFALVALVAPTPVEPPPMPPCEMEDSVGPCYWNASNRGNGLGTSFVVHSDGRVVHISDGKAHSLDVRFEGGK